MVQLLWKTIWQFLIRWNTLYDPTVVLSGIYPPKWKAYIHMKTWTWMLIADLFLIAKTQKQPRRPSVDEWKINCGTFRQHYIIQCSREEFSSHKKMCRKFKCIALGEWKGFPRVKNLLANAGSQEMRIWSLGREDPLEKDMKTYSSILAWRIPWTEEPRGLQFMGLPRVVHDWAPECAHAHTRTHRWMERLYDVLEKAKLQRQWNGQWLPGVGVRDKGQMGVQVLLGAVNTLYDTVMMGACHYMLVQIHIISDVSYVLQVVMV